MLRTRLRYAGCARRASWDGWSAAQPTTPFSGGRFHDSDTFHRPPTVSTLSGSASSRQSSPARYFPDADWRRKTPAEAGIDAALLQGAIDHAIAAEATNPRDLALNHYQTFGREPFGY